jgi:hypothetical protein
MVGLFIVGLGVLIGGIVGAGHPAAGEAEPSIRILTMDSDAFISSSASLPSRVGAKPATLELREAI